MLRHPFSGSDCQQSQSGKDSLMDEFNTERLLSCIVKKQNSSKYCKLVPKTDPHGNIILLIAFFQSNVCTKLQVLEGIF